MWKTLSITALLAGAGVALFVGSTHEPAEAQAAPTVHVTSSDTNTTTKKTELKFTVANLPTGTKIKDIHIYPPVQDPPTNPPKPPKFPKRSGTTVDVKEDNTTNSTSFNSAQNKDSSVHLTSSSGVGNGDFTVSLPWAWSTNKAPGLGTARIVFTKNGTKSYDDDDIVGGGTKLGGDFPVYALSLAGDDPVMASIGTTVSIGIESDASMSGAQYQIYSSVGESEWRDDALEVGVYSVSSPVPSIWGVTLGMSSGVLDTSGGASPSITIPNDPTLIGSEFYVVVALTENGDPWIAGTPVKVTIEP